MTTILAVQFTDRVEFIADNQVTAPNGRIYRHEKMSKISERNRFLIAGSGEVAACDIAQHLWNPPTPTAADKKDIYHFMIAKVIPSLKKCFKDNDYKLDGDSSDDSRFAFLISVCGQVFEIADDFSVSLSNVGYYGVGSGSSYGIGALCAGADLTKAIEIAAANDAYTSAPYIHIAQEK